MFFGGNDDIILAIYAFVEFSLLWKERLPMMSNSSFVHIHNKIIMMRLGRFSTRRFNDMLHMIYSGISY